VFDTKWWERRVSDLVSRPVHGLDARNFPEITPSFLLERYECFTSRSSILQIHPADQAVNETRAAEPVALNERWTLPQPIVAGRWEWRRTGMDVPGGEDDDARIGITARGIEWNGMEWNGVRR